MNNNGWDIIYAIRTDVITKDIQSNMAKLLTEFSFGGTIGAQSYKISGNFKPWSLINAGSSTTVGMTCPTENCSIDVTENGSTKTIPLQGIIPTMQFSLAFLDGGVAQSKSLRFAAYERDETTDSKGDIIVTHADSTNIISDKTLLTILNEAWHEVFWQNRKSLDYVFATVNLVPPSDSTWMAPKEMTYHFWNAAGNNSFLCILTMTKAFTITGMNPVPDPDLFAHGDGKNVFVSISPEMLMQKMVLPALGSSFKCNGSTIYGAKNLNISHTNYVHVTSITMNVSGTGIIVNFSGKAGIMTSSSMTFQGSQTESFSYNNEKLIFTSAPGNFHRQEQLSFWDGFLTGLTLGIYYGIEEGIQNGIASDISGVMGRTLNLNLGAVQWGSEIKLTINNARMNNAVILQAT